MCGCRPRRLLGEEGKGFELMMTKLAQERLAQAIRSATVAETVIDWTRRLHRAAQGFRQDDRRLPEHPVQARRAQDRGGRRPRVFTDKCIALFMEGELDRGRRGDGQDVSSEPHCKVVDECLQLFGGWGYMWEYPIARAYADARIVKIAGGSIEVMKTSSAGRCIRNTDLRCRRTGRAAKVAYRKSAPA